MSDEPAGLTPVPNPVDESTVDAPYGYKEDGTPYKRRPSATRKRKTMAPPAPRGGRSPKKYIATVKSLFQSIGALCGMFAPRAKPPATQRLQATTIAIAMSADTISKPAGEIIAANDKLAAMFEVATKANPYVDLAFASYPLVTALVAIWAVDDQEVMGQILENLQNTLDQSGEKTGDAPSAD